MAKKFHKIKAACFANSHEILKWMYEGVPQKEIGERVCKKIRLNSTEHCLRGLRAWVKDLGFKNQSDLRNNLYRYGLPDKKEMLNEAYFKKRSETQYVPVGESKPEATSDDLPQKKQEPMKKSLFGKPVELQNEDQIRAKSGLLPRKNRDQKNLSDRVGEKLGKN